jgi:hypothetical protein
MVVAPTIRLEEYLAGNIYYVINTAYDAWITSMRYHKGSGYNTCTIEINHDTIYTVSIAWGKELYGRFHGPDVDAIRVLNSFDNYRNIFGLLKEYTWMQRNNYEWVNLHKQAVAYYLKQT